MAISRMQEPRQLYGLGSLVKKITRPIKKIVKSPIGKAALIGLGGYALGGGFGASGFKFANIPGFTAGKNFLMGSPLGYKTASGSVARSGGLFSKLKGLSGSTKGILGLGAGAGLLGGLFAKQPEETEEEYQARIQQLGPYLKQYYSNVGDTFGDQAVSPQEVEDFVTSQSIEYQGAKDGGIMGYKDGGITFKEYLEGRGKEEKRNTREKLFKDYEEFKRRQKVQEQKTMAAEGGIIGAGGVTAEEMKKIKKSSEYKGWKRMYNMNADAAAEHPRHSEFLNVLKKVKKAEGGIIMADVDEMEVGPKGKTALEESMEVEPAMEDVKPTGLEALKKTLTQIAMTLYKVATPMGMSFKMAKAMYNRLPDISKQAVDDMGREMRSGMKASLDPVGMLDRKGEDDEEVSETLIMVEGKKDGGIMNLGGKEMDLRGGGFVPLGKKERADDVPARLSKNEFVFTADAVRAAGGGSVKKGAQRMYDTMKSLENRIR